MTFSFRKSQETNVMNILDDRPQECWVWQEAVGKRYHLCSYVKLVFFNQFYLLIAMKLLYVILLSDCLVTWNIFKLRKSPMIKQIILIRPWFFFFYDNLLMFVVNTWLYFHNFINPYFITSYNNFIKLSFPTPSSKSCQRKCELLSSL